MPAWLWHAAHGAVCTRVTANPTVRRERLLLPSWSLQQNRHTQGTGEQRVGGGVHAVGSTHGFQVVYQAHTAPGGLSIPDWLPMSAHVQRVCVADCV